MNELDLDTELKRQQVIDKLNEISEICLTLARKDDITPADKRKAVFLKSAVYSLQVLLRAYKDLDYELILARLERLEQQRGIVPQ